MATPFQQRRPMVGSIPRLRPVLLLIGFTATVAQILLMRELLVVFYGNEVSLGLLLASWLLWTGTGSSLFGRSASWLDDPRKAMAALQTLVSIVLPLTILAVRSAKGVFITVRGEILGPWPILLTALVVLCPFCALSGGAFSVGSRMVAQETASSSARATGSVYLLEAIGAGIGGLFACVVLALHLTSFQVAFAVGSLNLLAAVSLIVCAPLWRRVGYSVVVLMFGAGLIPFAAPRLETLSLARLWQGFHLLKSSNSAYGNLAVVETGNSKTLLENGLVLFTVPDPQAAEESVHFGLLQHPKPRSVLLIGGGLNGSSAEALKHSTVERIDLVELDPTIFDFGREYFAGQMAFLQQDPRVHLHVVDGRLFLKTTNQTFDVIILNLPEPQTAQINRFFTVEFFREAATKLNPGGILAFQLAASEDYISDILASFLRCINRSLREVFPEVTTIPGERAYFLATKQKGELTEQPDELLRRLKSRHVETTYVREYYLPFRMSPDRMSQLAEQIRPQPDTPLNHDFAPIAYYFDVALWSTQFSDGYRKVFAFMANVKFVWVVFGLTALLIVCRVLSALLRPRQLQQASVVACIGAMGFTLMALEVLLLLGFQAVYGYVYRQLAVLISVVMMGMALGSWLGLRRIGADNSGGQPVTLRYVGMIQIVSAISPMLLYCFFLVCERSNNSTGLLITADVLFPIAGLLCGMLGGYQFPLASSVFFTGQKGKPGNTGTLYAVDLLGACIGAIVLCAYLVPVFGLLKTAILILVLNLATALLAFTAALPEEKLPA